MIELKELKQKIENNTLDLHCVIYKCSKQSEFIPHQYALEFCKNNDFEIQHAESVNELPFNNLFGTVSNKLIIYRVESLDEDLNIEQEEVAQNYIWVICNKISAKYKKIYSDNIVEVPKLDDWQIKDFIASSCDKLTKKEVEELFSYYKNDLFRLSNELDKIQLVGDYNKVKSQLFVDISNFNIFDFTNAVIRKDKVALSNIYREIDNIDIEPFGLITLLINNFRHIIDIQLARNATAESVGVSGKQFWAIKNYSCGYYSKEELVEIFKFLNGLDYKIKSGQIDTSLLVDYIICKIMTI